MPETPTEVDPQQVANAAGGGSRAAATQITQIGDYVLDKTIGEGQFGKVKIATHVPTQTRVAVKIVDKSRLNNDTLRMVQREVAIMKMLHHPHIIRLYEVIETETCLFLVMEYASGGEMMDLIMAHGRLKECDACRFFTQTASALDYCHTLHTVHRDVKAENLLLDQHMNVKLIDFGLSNVFNPNDTLKTFCGSPTYASPELVQRREYTGPEVDCWSLGVLLFVLVVGELPFDGTTFLELYRRIITASYTIPDDVSPECADLIRRMLVPDVKHRANIKEILNHPWVIRGGYKIPSPADICVHRCLTEDELSESIVKQMVDLGFDKSVIIKSVTSDQYDEAAATYFLLVAQQQKQQQRLLQQQLAKTKQQQQTRKRHDSKDHRHSAAPSADPEPETSSVSPASKPIPVANSPSNMSPYVSPSLSPSPSPEGEPVMIEPRKHHTMRNPKVRRDDDSLIRSPQTTPKQIVSPVRPTQQAGGSTNASPTTGAGAPPPRPKKNPVKASSKNPVHFITQRPSRQRHARHGSGSGSKDGQDSPDQTLLGTAPAPPMPISLTVAPPGESCPTSPSTMVGRGSRQQHIDKPSAGVARPDGNSPVTYDAQSPSCSESGSLSGQSGSASSSGSQNSSNGGHHHHHRHHKKVVTAPRAVRFAFSVKMTSTLPDNVIAERIEQALKDMTGITYAKEHQYMFKCEAEDGTIFEIEICQLPHLSVNGVRFHRIHGDSWMYKALCKELMSVLNLA